ncbi:hypothetical protein BGY98DRAFT_936827 [Russula aff. rugulosa BPL654]|nr:hypothetical protein BGY98DRAFT_936827 [Russula aff. rugulosa BPL654]
MPEPNLITTDAGASINSTAFEDFDSESGARVFIRPGHYWSRDGADWELGGNISRTITFYASQTLRTIALCYRDFRSWRVTAQSCEDPVYLDEDAEKAEHYEVRVNVVNKMVENMKRVTSSEQEPTVEGYREEIKLELAKICEDIPSTSSTSTSFSLSLQAGRRMGDYHRYLVGFGTVASKNTRPTKLDTLSEESYKDSTLIMRCSSVSTGTTVNPCVTTATTTTPPCNAGMGGMLSVLMEDCSGLVVE